MDAERSRTFEGWTALCDSWIASRVSEFAPFSWSDSEIRFTRRKAFAEAGLYLYVARAFDGGDRARLAELADLLHVSCEDPRYEQLLRRAPRHVTLYSSPVLYLKEAGRLPERVASAVRDVLSGDVAWAVERVPHRILDIWHFCRAFGVRPRVDAVEAQRLSCLSHLPSPVQSTLSDAYALTHVVLFLTNFGVPSEAFPPIAGIPPAAQEVIEGLILRYLAEGNADIVLELVISALLIGTLRREILECVLVWLGSLIERHGFVPGPTRHVSDSAAEEDAYRLWAENYHTSFVAGTAFRLLRASGFADVLGTEEPAADPSSKTLGDALGALSRYELPLGAALLEQAIAEGAERTFGRVVERCREFLRQQQSVDGHFGYFCDEAAVLAAQTGNRAAFAEQFQRAIDDVCDRAVRSMGPVSEVASAGRERPQKGM